MPSATTRATPAPNSIARWTSAWEDVTMDQGTGVVHIAPGAGGEDFELSKVHDLPVLVARDEGFFKDEGLDIEFVTTPGMAQVSTKHFVKFDSIFDRPLDSTYNEGGIDTYRMCEWGIMKRAVEANTEGLWNVAGPDEDDREYDAIFVGGGASAIATILFTDALFHSDFITPVVLQKVQPLVAVIGAAIVLRERPRSRFVWFLVPALLGLWLVNQPHPFQPTANGLRPVIESLAAAVLWASGTVLGRYLGRELEFQHILSLRFFFGLIASAIQADAGLCSLRSARRQSHDRGDCTGAKRGQKRGTRAHQASYAAPKRWRRNCSSAAMIARYCTAKSAPTMQSSHTSCAIRQSPRVIPRFPR